KELNMNDNIIFSYTRKQAIEDGMQVEMDKNIVKEAGFKFPVFLTTGVHSIIEKAVGNKKHCNDFDGINWDILTMLRHGIQTSKEENNINFTVIITGAEQRTNHKFFAQIGAMDIDDPQPAITIMLPEED
ncbi:MAG: hypothetical protein K8R67_16465, partial [Desulfobacteraceae bacterium]|nr:hypothetical protein [Desulfobacteraceae bacterium]